MARANRAFCLGLLAASDVELSLAARAVHPNSLGVSGDLRVAVLAARGGELSGPPDVTVRHALPVSWSRPAAGKLVVIGPWGHGHLPREWAAGARDQADEVWVSSRFARDAYVRSGVPAEKVRVVAPGFDPELFAPEGPLCPLPTTKSHRFLFVGGPDPREGFDLLLAAYCRAFTADDDVCLTIVDRGAGTVDPAQALAEAVRRAQADPRLPELLYLDEPFPEAELAALYRACACVVSPYRAAGFCLPALEGMACGKPSIVTAGGPTDDFVDDRMGWRLPAYRRSAGAWTIGPYECVGDPWHLEPDREALASALRAVRDCPEEARARGIVARSHVEHGWTRAAATAAVRQRLLDLVAPPGHCPVAPARRWRPDAGRAAAGGGSSAARHARGKGRGAAKPMISFCLMARDEEPRIAQCLESIKPHVDEMIVVDTGSADRTREIAFEHGARVFDSPWADSFSIPLNQAIDHPRGDWIFWMDADDVLAPASGPELRRLVCQHPDRNVAFTAQVRLPAGVGFANEGVVDHIKLFPNRPELRFQFRDHQQILPALCRAGMRALPSSLTITHQHRDASLDARDGRRRRHVRLLDLDLHENPEHPYILYHLGDTHLHMTREYEVAVQYLQRCLKSASWRDDTLRLAHGALTAVYMAQEDWDAALAANEEGRSHFPDDPVMLLQAGQLYQQLGRWDEARRALERLVLGYDEPEYRCGEVGLRTYRGRHELALLRWRQGQLRHCEQSLREVAATYPSYLPARLHWVGALCAMGQTEEARQHLDLIPTAPGFELELQRLREQVGACAC